MTVPGDRYEGLLYRALNPRYARAPLSGKGAALFGGRFNAKGRPTLYLALRPDVALREANQVGTLQPTTLVAYRANLRPLFDARATANLEAYDMTADALAAPDWRARMLAGAPVPTQDLAERLIGEGYAGLLLRSYARGADTADLNLVLWRCEGEGASLDVIDDEGRLR